MVFVMDVMPAFHVILSAIDNDCTNLGVTLTPIDLRIQNRCICDNRFSEILQFLLSNYFVEFVSHRTKKLTLWRWTLFERPLDSFPAFYGTQRFNTEFTRYFHIFLL
jgi:hypothetical protein